MEVMEANMIILNIAWQTIVIIGATILICKRLDKIVRIMSVDDVAEDEHVEGKDSK